MSRKAGFILVLGILAATVGVRAALSAGTSTRERVESMRERLREQRFAVNSCVSAMGADELAVRIRLADTDSLRSRITALESLHSRGVPADSFPIYLELVDRFNRAVAAWDTLGGQARSRRNECQATVDAHNALTDSLRTLLAAEGLLPDSTLNTIDP